MNVFDFAIQMEEDGRIFYEKLAAEARVPELKAIFSLLAEEEREHGELFKAMKSGEDPVKVDSKVLQKTKNAFRKFLRKKGSFDILKGDPDGYRHLIRAEEDCIRLYEDMANREKNEHVAGLMLKIAEEERNHLAIMKNIYDFVETPKTFLAWGEFSNLREL